MIHIETPIPPYKDDDVLVVLAPGEATAGFTDEVTVSLKDGTESYIRLYVVGVDTAELEKFSPEICKLFGADSPFSIAAKYRDGQRRFAMGTRFTIYTLTPFPFEFWQMLEDEE